jgi:putative flippase GtrA
MKYLFNIPIDFTKKIFKRFLFIRYVFSGGTAAALDILILFILVTYFNVYYLSAATFAMTVSFIARFLLQKYITFENKDESQSKRQFLVYSILYAVSLIVTNFLLYIFVDVFHMWLVVSQMAAILLVASGCFFIYRLYIFK